MIIEFTYISPTHMAIRMYITPIATHYTHSYHIAQTLTGEILTCFMTSS